MDAMTTTTGEQTMSESNRTYFGPGFSMTVGPFHITTDADGYADLTGVPKIPELMIHATTPPVVEVAPEESAAPAKKAKAAKAEATTEGE